MEEAVLTEYELKALLMNKVRSVKTITSKNREIEVKMVF